MNQTDLAIKKIRILVGCPTSEHKAYCLDEYAEGLKKLTYADKDVLLIDNSEGSSYSERIRSLGIPVIKDEHFAAAKVSIVHSRNLLKDKALQGNYDYLLSLEQDVVPPPDIIERMLKAGEKIVTGIYFNYFLSDGELQMKPLVYKALSEETIRELTDGNFGLDDAMKQLKEKGVNSPHWRLEYTAEEVDESRVMEVGFCGLGCILIHRDVLEKITFRASEHSFDDMFFCEDARKLGHKIYADTSIKCRHYVKGMDWSRIRMW